MRRDLWSTGEILTDVCPQCEFYPASSPLSCILERMFYSDMSGLDAGETLAYATQARAISDTGEIALLDAACHWADLHGYVEDAGQEPGVSLPGMEDLVQLGGVGSPEVAEFAAAELGAQLALSTDSAAQLIGDALDLRHRLPILWDRVRAGDVRPWIGRRTAQATRRLSAEVVAAVDRQVSCWAHSLSWRRLENLIAATAMHADPSGAEQAAEEAGTRRGVWLHPSDDHGHKDIFIRTEAADGIWFDATIDRIADSLQLLGDKRDKDVRRARAVGIVANPEQTLDLFDQAAAVAGSATGEASLPSPGSRADRPLRDPRPRAVLYVHLAQDALNPDAAGVARFEGAGPITLEQAKSFLGHCHVTLKPVIDLADQTPVDAYEIPDRLREAVHLRSPVDVFPFATSTSRLGDLDHTVPYTSPDDGGPPGQTSLDNLGPMTRRHHRIRTHGRWQVTQPFSGVFVWRAPQGQHYLVDQNGTHRAELSAA